MCSFESNQKGRLYLCDSDAHRQSQIGGLAHRLDLDFEIFSDWSQLAVGASSRQPSCLIISDLTLAQAEQASGAKISDLPVYCAGGRLNLAGRGIATIVVCQQPEVNRVVRYMRAGARTVLPTPLETDLLLREISEAVAEDRERLREEERLENIRAIYRGLAERKRSVLQHMIDGRASKWSAHQLDVSRRTIELDRAEILNSFRVNNAIELARLIVETKCLPLNFAYFTPGENCSMALAK